MAEGLTKDVLSALPYLDPTALDPRTVNIMPLWDGATWRDWLPANGSLFEMNPLGVAESDYVAKAPASPTDLHVPFVEFMWQRASWPDLCPFIIRSREDIRNLATSLAKIDHFFQHRTEIGLGISNFVTTELEYLFTTSRSLFDLLQVVVARIWNRIELLDPTAQSQKKQLPESFRAIFYRKGELRTLADLQVDFSLPESIATFYLDSRDFFLSLRAFRDDVVHRGASVGLIYSTDRGFCVSPQSRPFDSFQLWKEEHKHNDNISSLRPFLAHIVLGTLNSCDRFVSQVNKQLLFPKPIAPDYRVFLRHSHGAALLAARAVADGGSPWWA